jgi:hypothetical protein
MAVVVKLHEKKEPVNELLGTVVAWGLIAGLLAKIFGFKFNFSDTDEMRSWGFSLGNAFKFSRQKLKNAGLSPEIQARCEAILDSYERRIKARVQEHGRLLETNPAAAARIPIDNNLTALADEAVDKIEEVLTASLGSKARERAEEMVSAIRGTFGELKTGLVTITSTAGRAALSRDTRLMAALDAAVASLPAADRDAKKQEILNALVLGIIA